MKLQILKNVVKSVTKTGLLLISVAMLTINANAQKPQPPKNMVPGTDIYTAVQQQAEFPGGVEKYSEYLAKNIHYPAAAKAKKVQGRVFLSFVVEEDGSLSNIKLLRGIGSGCDEEAIRVMKNSPKWAPGKQNGRIVRSQFNVPIMFSLKA